MKIEHSLIGIREQLKNKCEYSLMLVRWTIRITDNLANIGEAGSRLEVCRRGEYQSFVT